MSQHPPEADLELELDVIDAVGLGLEHVPNVETEAYDACVRGYFHTSSEGGRLFGWTDAAHETRIEIKTCQRWISDRGSNGGRRRGSWYIDRDAHEQLVERDGLYLLVLRDGDDIIAWVLVPAKDLDPDLEWSENGGRRVARARHPWTAVFVPEHLASEGGSR